MLYSRIEWNFYKNINAKEINKHSESKQAEKRWWWWC